ncbi:cysteine hydrolase family protein [Weissella sagaensis]|uniref:Cysteine hydrolase family protein n=1 Tax=Weissella sagaensis TaxID=2559928 RepID=A0ABW1RRZ5_9LACO|nr:isochorismatase family cysteine hydrolase [Weissella sagaensis]QDJ58548.1 cysteine hydrolase [Weissella hellenica]QEA57489.1 cysteine hydrolase [Weissella hellenica]UEG66651.1 cysteine hydrolase [Weissella hellenica]
MTKALLIIDYTNDFVADEGTLTCGKSGQALESYIVEQAQKFLDNDDYVILPTDTHFENDIYHPEYKMFPPHNIIGTWGQQYYGQLQSWYLANQHHEKVYRFDKNRYSAFQNTNLDNFLRERQINDLCLVGVCTDICVLHTAIYGYNLNYQLTVLKDGVATFTEHGQEWALEHFKNSLGINVI